MREHDRSKLWVMLEKCNECLFSEHALVSTTRRREILAQCDATGTHFVCHKATQAGGHYSNACCRAFYDRWPAHSPAMRLAAMLDRVRFVAAEDL